MQGEEKAIRSDKQTKRAIKIYYTAGNKKTGSMI
jgi:hypothetical protein